MKQGRFGREVRGKLKQKNTDVNKSILGRALEVVK